MSYCRSLTFLFAIAMAWPSHSQIVGFPDCHFNVPPPPQDAGAQLAMADRLVRTAKAYEDYPYEWCFRLGRSCSNEIDSRFDQQAAEPTSNVCRHVFPRLNPLSFEDWRQERQDYNACMSTGLRLRAEEIREAVFDSPELPALDQVLVDLADDGSADLARSQVAAAVSDTTWCPVEATTYRAGILCRGGGFVVASGQGEQRFQFSLTTDALICISDFMASETCHRIAYADGTFTLSPGHPQLHGAFVIVDGVETGTWQTTCAAR